MPEETTIRRVEHAQWLRTAFRAGTLATRPAEVPQVNLDHAGVMTDDTGMLQHATYNALRYEEASCLDDNARALLLMTLIEDSGSADPKTVPTPASPWPPAASARFWTGSTNFGGIS